MKRFIALVAAILLAAGSTACNKMTGPPSESTDGSSSFELLEQDGGMEHSSSASVPDDEELSLEDIQEKYIRPLGLTRVIGTPWAAPGELDPDSVLVTLEIKILDDEQARKIYDQGDEHLHFPKDYAEKYAQDFFGMQPDDLQKSRYYNGALEAYLIPIGLGGAWDVEATSFRQDGDLLEIEYHLIDGMLGIPSADGLLSVRFQDDGTHQYLSNQAQERIYFTLQFPAAMDMVVTDGTAVMSSGGQMSMGPDENNMTSYDGEDLSNIISFYESALKQAGATGNADAQKYPDGWTWTGTYEDGKNLSIDIQPADVGKEYIITIFY